MTLFLPLPGVAFPLPEAGIFVTPSEISQGEVSLLTIQKNGETMPKVLWMENKVALAFDKEKDIWFSFVGADLTTEPGSYKLEIDVNNNAHSKIISVLSKDYGARHLTIPEGMVSLKADTLKRVEEESRRMNELFMSSTESPVWSGKWIRPVSGTVVSLFGCKSIINDMERAPHSGIDLKASEGTRVRAANKGKVVLVEDHFFSGLSIVIDHGGGIHSMYFHLSRSFVQVDQFVEKGVVIGLSGSSGRITGPHLHFGIRLNGKRINPVNLMEISERLEKQ